MARIIGVLVIVVVLIGALGLWRGWFTAETSNSQDHAAVKVNVDKSAIRQDADAAQEKAQQAGAQLRENLSATTQPTTRPAQ